MRNWCTFLLCSASTCAMRGMQVTCEGDGLCRVGWATRAGAYEIGKDRRSFGYGSTGKKSHGGNFEDYGKPFGKVITLTSALCSEVTVTTSCTGDAPWDMSMLTEVAGLQDHAKMRGPSVKGACTELLYSRLRGLLACR